MRRVSVFLAMLMVLGSASGSSAQPATWQNEVRALLVKRAKAVLSGDGNTFRATMRGAPADFVSNRMTWFSRIRSLPLGVYSLELFDGGFGDLATSADRRGAETHIVQVKERIGFRGYDRTPADEDLFLTVRKLETGWAVTSDSDRDPLFLLSMRNMWDFGSISNVQRDGVMVIVHPAQRSVADRILTDALQARDTARSRWPYPWRDPIIIMVPSTVQELARILQTQYDLSAFVAFASASEDRGRGWALTGFRVFLHWQNFSKYGSSYQQTILDHEFTHLASFDSESPFMPAFMDEGIAQFYGEAAGHGPRPEERRSIASGVFAGRLPDDWEFSAGTEDEIFRAYEEGLSFVAYLGDRFGREAGARAFIALAKRDPISPGTADYQIDQAFRATLRVSLPELERGWAANERAELR